MDIKHPILIEAAKAVESIELAGSELQLTVAQAMQRHIEHAHEELVGVLRAIANQANDMLNKLDDPKWAWTTVQAHAGHAGYSGTLGTKASESFAAANKLVTETQNLVMLAQLVTR